MPVLFGNTYMLPVIIVVVLLLLLLLIIMMRKRGAGTGAPKPVSQKQVKPVGKPPKEPKPTKTKVASADVTAPLPTMQQAEQVAESAAEPGPAAEVGSTTTEPVIDAPAPAPKAVQPPVVVPAPRHEAPRADSAVKTDPLHSVILDLLQGWGDVTEEDTRRLAVFRPDKVLAAVQTMELPKELKSNQGARTRLIQLRQAAAELVEKEKKRQAAAPRPSPKAPETKIEGEPEKRPLAEAFPAFSLIPEPPQAFTPSVDSAKVSPPVPAQPADDDWSTAWQTNEPAEPAVSAMEMPAEAEPVGPMETEPFMSAEEPVAPGAGAGASWTEHEVAPAPEWQIEEPSEFLEPRESLSGLRGTIKTADELLRLPTAEQTEMAAFLGPEELAKAFTGTTDPGVKKAIIDTLEHVSNPASLDVLRRCLDDPDPEIQIYALEAADRLLGVD